MAFLRDDEFIILMDLPLKDGRWLTIDELKRLRGAGIQTAYWHGTKWDSFMPHEGVYDWSYFDKYLERMRQADMKCLIPLWTKQYTHYPDSYYIYTKKGHVRGALSPWNKEAQKISNDLLKMVRDRLTSDRCQVVSGQLDTGERVLLNEPAYYDAYALADWQKDHEGQPDHRTPDGDAWLKKSYLDLLKTQQKIMVHTQHHEIWYCLSRKKALVPSISCHGCNYLDDILDMFKSLKPKSINHISFNYFPYGEDYWKIIARDRETWKINEFAGAEYCEGLKSGNGIRAVKQGLRGMIVGPTFPATRHTSLESWMVDEIKKTHAEFMKRKNASKA